MNTPGIGKSGRPLGLPKTGGRVKGTRNRTTSELQEKLAALNCDPIEELVKIARDPKTETGTKASIFSQLMRHTSPIPKPVDDSNQDLSIGDESALTVAEVIKLAQYVLERFGPNATPQQEKPLLKPEGKLTRQVQMRRNTMSTKRNITARSSLLKFAAALRPLLAEGLANDLAGFAKEAWRVLHPGRPLIWSWHYDLLCEYLLLVKRRALRRVIFNLPPRSAKSTLITIIYPVWTWLSEPEHDFLMVSYSLTLSTEHSIRRRNLLLSRWAQSLWTKKLQLTGGRNQAEQFVNNRGGQMIATSTGASVMGRGADTAILDDPVSADQALSAAERTRANNWIDTTLRSRLNDPAKGAIILVMQRLHQFDPTGFLLEQEPSVWTHVCIPLEAEKDESWAFPISGRVVQRKRGEILMPERFSPAVVEELRSRRMVFAGQYQQRPAPFEGYLGHIRLRGPLGYRRQGAEAVHSGRGKRAP